MTAMPMRKCWASRQRNLPHRIVTNGGHAPPNTLRRAIARMRVSSLYMIDLCRMRMRCSMVVKLGACCIVQTICCDGVGGAALVKARCRAP